MMIAQSDLFAGSIHSQFVYLIAVLVVLVGAYFAVFKPAGNFILGYSPIVLGSISFTRDLSFAKIIALIQVMGALHIITKYLLEKNKRFRTDFFRKNAVVVGLILLLWMKILVDCTTTGMDEFRSLALKYLLMNIITPLCLMVFDRELNGAKKAAQHAITGMMVFSVIFLVTALPSVIIDKGFQHAFSEQYISEDQYRFSTLGTDPINYGRFFFFGLCGCLLTSLQFNKLPIKWALYGMSFVFFVFIVASGTRQFLLASLCFMLFLFSILKMKKVLYISVFAVFLFISTLGFIENISSYVGKSGSVLDRFSIKLISDELADNRGEIWRRAYAETLNNFALGVGFRRFGDPAEQINPDTKESYTVLDSAHGFFQDLFVEHGIFMGFAFLAFYFRSLWSVVRNKKNSKIYYGNYLLLIGLSLSVSEFFTGSVFGSLGVYISIIFAYCDDEEVVKQIPANAVTHPRLAEISALRSAN